MMELRLVVSFRLAAAPTLAFLFSGSQARVGLSLQEEKMVRSGPETKIKEEERETSRRAGHVDDLGRNGTSHAAVDSRTVEISIRRGSEHGYLRPGQEIARSTRELWNPHDGKGRGDQGLTFSPIAVAGVIAILLFVLWYCYYVIYNIFFHPLRAFPGPKIAGATRLYEAYFELFVGEGGQFVFELDRLHEEYGPIVRISPNEVHVNDLDFLPTLYALGPKRYIPTYMSDIFGLPSSHIGTQDHDLHRQRRAALSPFFSKRSIQHLEGVIVEKVHQLCDSLGASQKLAQPVNLRVALIAMIMDIITEYSFGKCVGALDRPDFSPAWSGMITGVSAFVPVAKLMPKVQEVAQRIPPGLVRPFNPAIAAFTDFVQILEGQVAAIIRTYDKSKAEVSQLSTGSTQHVTIFSEILTSNMPEHEKSVDRLTQEAVAVVAAAGETTSNVLVTTIFQVLSNPNIHQKLTAELDDAIRNTDGQISWRELEQLPYLTAIIKEGLRMTVPAVGRSPLYAKEPLNYRDWIIPPGASISMTHRDYLYDEKLYPSATTFLPERWLTTDAAEQKKMNTGFVPFGTGPRICTGMNLAYAVLYHSLSAIFHRFDMRLVDSNFERDVKMTRDYFAAKPSKKSKGVKVKVINERHQ